MEPALAESRPVADLLPPRCVHVFPSFGVGGVPLRMARIINDLGPALRHVIVALDGATGAKASVSPEIDCSVISEIGGRASLPARLRSHNRSLRQFRPDLLVTYNWGAIEWAMANRLFTGAPHLHHEAGFGKEEVARQLPRRVWFRRWALRQASKVVVPSRSLERIAREEWQLPPAQVLYLPNGIDVARFSMARRDPAGDAHERREPMVVGTVAPLRPEKNVGRLISAFAIARARLDLRLVIVGDGAERAQLETMARELGVAEHISFLGQVDHPEKALAELDIFALSSDTEQMPNAVLEAMAAALPVASVAVGDVGEMLARENAAFVVARNDTAALADAILRLARLGPLRRHEIGLANFRRVQEKYSHAAMVENWRVVLTEAMTRSHRDAPMGTGAPLR